MKVIFLVKSDYTPSSRIRINDLIPFLKVRDIDVTVEILPKSSKERKNLFKKVKDYDITVIQKRLLKYWDFVVLRKHAKKMVFDFDDAIYLRSASPSTNPKDYISYTRKRLFQRIVKGADLVIAANNILAAKAVEISKDLKIKVIPSTIDITGITDKKEWELSDPIILGWIGTKSTLRYLNSITPALSNLADKYNIVLRVVADQPADISGIKMDFIEWKLDKQYDEIAKFDIGIMPLTSDPFSEGKASFKLLQYLAVGVPSVCSPVGMNIDVAQEGKYALLATTPEQFYEQISKLIDDIELRKQLSGNGKTLIAEKYCNEYAGKLLAEALIELHNR